MWLFLASGRNNGHLRRCLALGRVAPEPAVILTGSQYTYDAPNCTVLPFDDRRAEMLAWGASRVLFDYRPYAVSTKAPTVLIQRTPDGPIDDTPVSLAITAGPYETGTRPGPVTEGWVSEPIPAAPHRVVVVASGPAPALAWYADVTRRLLIEQLDPILVTHAPLPGLPCVSGDAHDYIASADVVVGMAGFNTSYEALCCGKPFVAGWLYEEQRKRLEAMVAAGEAVVELGHPRLVADAVARVLELAPTRHVNGVPAALKLVRALQ